MSTLERDSMTVAEMRKEVSRLGLSKKAKKARNGLKARLRPLEDDIQRDVVDWLAPHEQSGRLLYFHVPNGGKRNVVVAMKLKRLGTRAGVPDLVIVPATGPVVFIELKAGKNKPTDEQEYWLKNLPHYGCPVRVCRSLDEVQQFLYETGVIREVAP